MTDRPPAAGATGVPTTGTTVSATFSETVAAGSPVVWRHQPGARRWPAPRPTTTSTRTVTFTPTAALAASTTYTVSVSGAKDTAGNTMDPVTWTFTTAASSGGCPCTIWPSTATPDHRVDRRHLRRRARREVPSSSQAGYITGHPLLQGTGNTGTHIGPCGTAPAPQLATVTFTGETATGWQQATFAAPVPVTANTTYVASYYAPVGRYSDNNSYFASAATTRGPLTALRNGTDGGNGVYRYGASRLPEQHLPVDATTGSTWSSTPPRSTPRRRP